MRLTQMRMRRMRMTQMRITQMRTTVFRKKMRHMNNYEPLSIPSSETPGKLEYIYIH
jgi:hypothetical protein